MKRNKPLLSWVIFLLIANLFVPLRGEAQSVYKLPDPDGVPVKFSSDSLFAYKHRFMDHMVMYAIDGDGQRNVMVTNAQDSYWAFDTGKPLSAEFTPFLWVSSNQVLFAIDSVWYKANDDFTDIEVFNDNRDTANSFIFLFAADIYTNTWIVALDRNTGNRVLLSYNSVTEQYHRYLDIDGNDLRVSKWVSLDIGSAFNDTYFVGSTFNTTDGEWSLPGLYRIKSPNRPELLITLGERNDYVIKAFNWLESFVVDYMDGGDTRIYEYNSGLDSLLDVTTTILGGSTVLDVSHLKTPYVAEDEIQISDMTIWKVEEFPGQVTYLLRRDDGFMPEWELEDIEGSQRVDILISSYFEDSIYYYNYDDPGHGLVRMNFFNENTRKDLTSIPFSSNHELFGWEGKMYYAKYDAVSNKVYARLQDFDDYSNRYLQGSDGMRIENPVVFYPLSEYMIVESQTQDGNVLYLYHPTLVGVDDLYESRSIVSSPNPCNGEFHLRLPDDLLNQKNLKVDIMTMDGKLLHQQKLLSASEQIDLGNFINGMYLLRVSSESRTIATERIVVIK